MRKYFKKKYPNENLLVDLIGVYNNFEEIDFNLLPEKFVLKCNHGSGYNIVVKDKKYLNIKEARKKINKWMNEDYGFKPGFEIQYREMPRKILCESYLGDNLKDIQFWCSKGKVIFISYIESPHGNNYKKSFDTIWNELPFVSSLPILDKNIKKPKKLNRMIEISKEISKKFLFVRVDFYILNDETIKISEITFTPASGIVNWYPKKYNKIIGEKIEL